MHRRLFLISAFGRCFAVDARAGRHLLCVHHDGDAKQYEYDRHDYPKERFYEDSLRAVFGDAE